ncbi:hypothetical protein ONZ43_g2077 [Nemania bipapillata]|uniref:Uncharacterized protein n=1 Tax=Nemania bipapillata TaxID=110536 RepID=A0ACC2J200_9PEZI|nr:hypothetical protein ONZ43_g2077 [Nemania bipapillata]
MPASASLPRQVLDLEGPSIPAPPGQLSQLDSPPNGNHIAIPFITTSAVVSAVFYVIRFYAKYLGKKLNISDYLVFVAFITFLATLLYLWIIGLVKCAILLEWVEIFVPRGERNYFSWVAYATCLAFASLSIIIFSLDLANCTPFEGNWNLLVPGRTCRFEVPQFVLASATTNFVLDLIPLILVQRVIWNLQLSWQKKAGVSILFLVGLAALAANVVRLYYATRFYVSDDVSYYFSILAITTLAETFAANLVLCIPFTPKALLGLQQTKLYSTLKGYGTVKSDEAYTNQSDNHLNSHELRPIRKPRDHWFMSSKLDTNQTVTDTVDENSNETESQRRLRPRST